MSPIIRDSNLVEISIQIPNTNKKTKVCPFWNYLKKKSAFTYNYYKSNKVVKTVESLI